MLEVALAAGCTNANRTGASGAIAEPDLDVVGTWTGTWESDDPLNPAGASGTIEIVLVGRDDSNTVDSATTLTGTDCFTSGENEFTPIGVHMEGRLIFDIGTGIGLAAILDALDSEMSGTYEVISQLSPHPNPNCEGDFGTITATRS